MTIKRAPYWAIGTVAAGVLCGCAATQDEAGAADYNPYPGAGGTTGAGGAMGGAGGGGATGGSGGTLPPEQEVESSYESPVATGRFVWIANPASGRVAYVDAVTLEVKTTEAGNGPEFLAAVPASDEDVAIVINSLSSTATVLRADGAGNIDTAEVPVAAGSNAWAVAKTGAWAIAWTDARNVAGANAAQGFQDITVVSTGKGQPSSTRLSVGYRPVALSFSEDGKRAYAVTQDGVSVVDLEAPGGPAAIKLVPIAADPLEDQGTRDVAITPDGKLALVRRDGTATINVVDLESGNLVDVVLSGNVTDMDVSPDGQHAVAVVRDTGDVAVLPIPGIATQPSAYSSVTVEGTVVGSVAMASGAGNALLYSNATEQERVVQIDYEASPPSLLPLKLHAPVLAVFLASTGASAIVLHQPGAAGEQCVGAFSVMNIAPLLPAKIVGTQAPPSAVALTPAGDFAVVAERDDVTKVYGAYLIRAANQQVDRYQLASPPIAVGALTTAQRAFVAQKHPEGRLTFIDLDTGQARTLTGFELGARVVDGSE